MRKNISPSTLILTVLSAIISTVFVFALINNSKENEADFVYASPEGLSVGVYDPDAADVMYYGGSVINTTQSGVNKDDLDNIATVSGRLKSSGDGYLEAALKSQLLAGGSLSNNYVDDFLNSIARSGNTDPIFSDYISMYTEEAVTYEQSEKAGVLFARAIKQLIVFVTGKEYHTGGSASMYGDDIIPDEILVPLSDKPASSDTQTKKTSPIEAKSDISVEQPTISVEKTQPETEAVTEPPIIVETAAQTEPPIVVETEQIIEPQTQPNRVETEAVTEAAGRRWRAIIR